MYIYIYIQYYINITLYYKNIVSSRFSCRENLKQYTNNIISDETCGILIKLTREGKEDCEESNNGDMLSYCEEFVALEKGRIPNPEIPKIVKLWK